MGSSLSLGILKKFTIGAVLMSEIVLDYHAFLIMWGLSWLSSSSSDSEDEEYFLVHYFLLPRHFNGNSSFLLMAILLLMRSWNIL